MAMLITLTKVLLSIIILDACELQERTLWRGSFITHDDKKW
jgi:hypothetical protein